VTLWLKEKTKKTKEKNKIKNREADVRLRSTKKHMLSRICIEKEKRIKYVKLSRICFSSKGLQLMFLLCSFSPFPTLSIT